EDREENGNHGAPNPPRSRRSTKNGVEANKKQTRDDQVQHDEFQLLAHPLTKILSGHSVGVFAEEIFVNVEGESEQIDDEKEWDRVEHDLESLEACSAFGEIAHSRGYP